MGFFDDVYKTTRWSHAASNVPPMSFAPRTTCLPGRLPWTLVLARTNTICIALDSVSCWPEHFSANIVVFSVHQSVDVEKFLPFPGGLSERGPRHDVQGIRFAMEFSDGRYATNLMVPRTTGSRPESRSSDFPIFTPWGGTGSGGGGPDVGRWRYVQRIDLWPLPSPGKMAIILDWQEQAIPETRHEVDGDEIRLASERASSIWGD